MALTISLIVSLLLAALLIFIILCPMRWASIVEKENRYWVEKGVFKATTVEKFERFEKSVVFKILIIIGMLGFLLTAWLPTL